MSHCSCAALLARPGLVGSGEWLICLEACVCGAVTTDWMLFVFPSCPPDRWMHLHDFPDVTTWMHRAVWINVQSYVPPLKNLKHDCLALEAGQARPPVCQTACLLDFPWIPWWFRRAHLSIWLSVSVSVYDWEKTNTTERKTGLKTRWGTLKWLRRPFINTNSQDLFHLQQSRELA